MVRTCLEESYALANSEGDDLLGLLVRPTCCAPNCRHLSPMWSPQHQFHQHLFLWMQILRFQPRPRESDTYFLTLDQMAQKAVEAWQLGATEVCIQGDCLTSFRSSTTAIFCAPSRAPFPACISRVLAHEIVYGVELTGMRWRTIFPCCATMDSAPAGTAAEILDDQIRHILSANKLSTAQWVEVIAPRTAAVSARLRR